MSADDIITFFVILINKITKTIMEITLKILKDDIMTLDYCNGDNCAIARAVNRLNDPQIIYTISRLISPNNKEIAHIDDLEDTVVKMYRYKRASPLEREKGMDVDGKSISEPKDFEYKVNVNLEENVSNN
jgi:hypothetical protein